MKSFLEGLLAFLLNRKGISKYDVAHYTDEEDILKAKAVIVHKDKEIIFVIEVYTDDPKVIKVLDAFYKKATKFRYVASFAKSSVMPELKRLESKGFILEQEGIDRFIASLV